MNIFWRKYVATRYNIFRPLLESPFTLHATLKMVSISHLYNRNTFLPYVFASPDSKIIFREKVSLFRFSSICREITPEKIHPYFPKASTGIGNKKLSSGYSASVLSIAIYILDRAGQRDRKPLTAEQSSQACRHRQQNPAASYPLGE